LTCRFVTFGGAFRAFGNTIVSCYLPVYFQKVYPQYTSQYSIINAGALVILGFLSIMIGGIIGEKFE
jgi:hypothetical protein